MAVSTRAAALAAVAVAWLFVRPYGGIRHDARLYFAQALYGGNPAFLSSDLLIANDRQMQFSVYGQVLEAGLRWFDPGTVALVATAVGLVAWIFAASWLGWTLTRKWWWLVAIAIPLAGTMYGPYGTFMFAEGFATPRAIAEAIAIVAIAIALRRRTWLALGIALSGLLVHPLVAITGVIAVACIAAVGDRRWRWVLVVAFPIAVAAIWADPLDIGGARAFDTTWRAVIEARSPQVFLGQWDARGWELAAAAIVIVGALGIEGQRERVRALSAGIIGATVVGLVSTGVLADVLGSPLGTQLQLWRTAWLAQLGVGVAVGLAIVAAFEHKTARAVLRVVLVAIVLSLPVLTDGPAFLAALAVTGGVLITGGAHVSDRFARVALIVLASAAAVVALAELTGIVTDSAIATNPRPLVLSALPALAPTLTIGAATLLAAAVVATRREGVRRWVSAALSVAVAVALLATWDGRSDWIRFVEGSDQPQVPAAATDVVLVEDDHFSMYSLFARPLYFNATLGAGVVFSRDLALQYEEHRTNAAMIEFLGSTEDLHDDQDPSAAPQRKARDLTALCKQPGAPDVLLLRVAVLGIPTVEWRPDIAPDGQARLEELGLAPTDRFFRYECEDVLATNNSSV